MAPFHPVGQNPTLAIERDLDLIVAMDRLGFDEAWIGEHHSAGFEIIASPEVFIAVAAERTKHIKLGTGVSSLPYHHPLMLADRMVLLDHLTRGRAMLGVRPGPAHLRRAHARDPRGRAAAAHGAEPRRDHAPAPRRDRHHAHRLVHAPGRAPAAEAVQRPVLRRRGRGVLLAHRRRAARASTASACCRSPRPRKQGMDLLAHHWDDVGGGRRSSTATSPTGRSGGSSARCTSPRPASRPSATSSTASRSSPATSRTSCPPVRCRATPPAEIIENNQESGFAVIGTPEDAVAKIEELVEASNGGFGAFLLFDHDWAPPAAKLPQLRAVRAVRDAALHRPARGAAGVVRLGHRQRGRVRRTGLRTRSARRSRTTPPSRAAKRTPAVS